MVLATPGGGKARDPGAGEGHPWRVGPGSHPRPVGPGVGGRLGPSRTPALLPGRRTKLISILSSPVTNVMSSVNKPPPPPAGHGGNTQAQTRCGGRARAHPESGRRIRAPNWVLVGGDYERAAKFITLSYPPRAWRWRGNAAGPQWGVIPFPAPRSENGIGPGSSSAAPCPLCPAASPPPIPSHADVPSPIN